MNTVMYDLIIIGAGPAGLTAAIYASRKKLKTLIISKDIGGQASLSSDIENYLGFSLISGVDLTAKFREHLEHFPDLEILEGVEVTGLATHENGCFDVIVADNTAYHSKTLLIASGKRPRLMGITGEKEFFGRGVATCATCDAPLFKEKTVAVVGGGNSAMDAILNLTKFASKVYSININAELGGDEILKQNVLTSKNVEVLNNTQALQVLGEQHVTGLSVQDKNTLQNKTIPLDGIFVEIGYVSNIEFDTLTQKDAHNQIVVDKDLKTSIPGIFAAGDVNDLWGEQIVIAAGEGAKAAMRVAEYLGKTPGVSPVCLETSSK